MGTKCISHSNTEDAVMCHTVSFHEAEQLFDNTVTCRPAYTSVFADLPFQSDPRPNPTH